LAATKMQALLFMIACIVSGALAIVMGLVLGSVMFMLSSLSGFTIGAFFAYKYFTFGKKREREEQHRRNRHHKH
jgi:uncharacterized membrane protein YdjX (TVP38/TMEM64 family)